MQLFISSLGIITSLLTATGVFLHDGKIDRAYTSAAAIVRHDLAANADLALSANLHNHPEHIRLVHGNLHQSPSIPPREHKMKRYLQQNIEPHGRHSFDSHNFPLPHLV